MLLTDYTSYADAQRHFASAHLWDLFDGDRERLNIAHECIDRHATDPHRIAIRIAHAEGRDEAISFRTIADMSSRYAHWLADMGVAPGDRVAIMLGPSLAFYASLFAAMKLGAIAVPLFTLFGPDGVRLRIDDCSPRLLLTTADKADALGSLSLPVIAQDDAFHDVVSRYPVDFKAVTRGDDLAIYQYTSGTTRELPAAIHHTHRAIVVVMIAALYGTGIRPGDKFFCPSSPAWGHGLWHGTLAPLALGVETGVYAGRFEAERLLRALQDFGTTNLSAAATHYRMMRTSGVATGYRYALRKLSFTGEPIARKPGALGMPVPGVSVQVQRLDGSICAPGEIGEIKVWRHGTWFATKDRGWTDEDGFFFHAGRADDVIISAGWTMSATEIENVLLRHPSVREAAAIGVPDTQRGQVVKAFVVTGDQQQDDELARDIQDFVRTRLSQHEYPRIVAFVAELPKTPAGKVNRKALREREMQGQT
jgi:acetyl-CoA synthetase